MPRPVSEIWKTDRPGWRSAVTVICPLARRKLDRVSDQVIEHAFKQFRIAGGHHAGIGLNHKFERYIILLGGESKNIEQMFEHLGHRQRLHLHIDFALLKTNHIQNIIHHIWLKRCPRFARHLDVLDLFRRAVFTDLPPQQIKIAYEPPTTDRADRA